MAADLHIHILTNEMSEFDLRCFFSHTLGSKWFGFNYECEETRKQNRDYDRIHQQFRKEFPAVKGNIFQESKEAQDRWSQLLKEHYKKFGHSCSHHERIENSPNIWIGEVSWLKAALFEDSDTFIPDTIDRITEIIGEDLPIINDDLIQKVVSAFDLENNTKKEDGVWNGSGYALTHADEVKKFLEIYKGFPCFTVSW